jgi:hypothetical protein
LAASAAHFAEQARQAHFEQELTRARARWQSKPGLAECAQALHETADLSLCQSAEQPLLAIEQLPDAPPERALPLLADAALALTRLTTRLRYLSLSELSAMHSKPGAAGAPPVPSASASQSRRQSAKLPLPHDAARSFELTDSPVARLLTKTSQLERDVVRNIAAYLEYAPLPVRRSAFVTVQRLRSEHPGWPLVLHLLREAWLLESDGDLKRELQASSSEGNLPVHSAESK